MAKKANLSALAKKSRNFYRFYTTLVWIMILACVFGWIYLNKTLSSYENSLAATHADAVLKELQSGDYSSLPGLSDHDMTALKSHIAVYGLRYAEKKEISREKGDYTYRITSQGFPVADFTLTPDGSGWKSISARVTNELLEEYTDTIALEQVELVADRICACDYSQLYSIITPTGYSEDTHEAFEAFMRKHTPERSTMTFTWKNDGDKRVYDIVSGKSLFGRVTLSQADESTWQIDNLAISDSLIRSYILSLADTRANTILGMVQNLQSESLYRLCVANGYPADSLSGFDALMRSVPSIENARCALFENSDSASRSYLISTENERIASFTLSSHETSGAKMWVISAFEMPVWIPFEGTVTAPACYTVTVDGKTLGAGDEISRTVPKNIDRVLIENVPDMVTEVTYRIQSAFPPETIHAVREDGSTGVYTALSDHEFRFDLPTCDDRYKDKLNDFLVAFSQAWGHFSMNDTPYAEMVKYVEQLSTAYVYIYGGDYAWIKDHYKDRTTFSNFQSSNFVEYTPEIIACDISYDMTVVYVSGDTAETYSPAYRLYLRNTNGTWKVFSFNAIGE